MIKKYKIWAGLLVLALAGVAVPGCTQSSRPSSPSAVDVNVLQEMMTVEKVTLINVSGLLSCLDSKIPGSLCLSCDEKKDTAVFSNLAKNSKIVFYTGGIGLDQNCPLLEEAIRQEFANVSILQGGLRAGRQAGYPVVTEKRIPRLVSLAVNPRNISEWRKRVKNPLVIDIRPANAYAKDHLEGAVNFPLTWLHVRYAGIPLDRTLLIVDEDGTESLLAASYLARKGFLNISRLKGGMADFRRGSR